MEQLHKYTSIATIVLALVTIVVGIYGISERPFDRLGQEIESVEKKIDSLSEQVTLVRVGIAGVQGQLPHIEQRITNLETR